MTLRNKVAFWCLAIPTLVELGLGVIYFTSAGIMPYHQEVVGVGWSELPPGARTMLTALVNAYGSAHFAVGVALSVLLLIPFRRGEAWARWAILAAGLPVIGGTAYVSARLAYTTGAHMPWPGALALLALFVLGAAIAQPRAS
jgi:hypothetical protein